MWARIENNKVLEVVDTDPTGKYHDSLVWVECDNSTAVGSIYNSGSFTNSAASVIAASSASKLRLYEELRDAGKWTQIKAALDSNEDALNTWNFANIIERDHPLIDSFKASLGWTDQEIQDLFNSAKEV